MFESATRETFPRPCCENFRKRKLRTKQKVESGFLNQVIPNQKHSLSDLRKSLEVQGSDE